MFVLTCAGACGKGRRRRKKTIDTRQKKREGILFLHGANINHAGCCRCVNNCNFLKGNNLTRFASAWPIVREVLPFGTSNTTVIIIEEEEEEEEEGITSTVITIIITIIENDPILIPVCTS